MYGVALMVKDEQKNILKSLNSCRKMSHLFIYDTGSTDNTLSIIKDWGKENDKPVYIKQGNFIDFATSRNVLLDFIDTKLLEMGLQDLFVLLLDSNDELSDEDEFEVFLEQAGYEPFEVYHVRQCWYSNNNAADVYLNFRLIRFKITPESPKSNWRYQGAVHEYLKRNNTPLQEGQHVIGRPRHTFMLYQNRADDNEKSEKRYQRDIELLLNDLENNVFPSRTLYYLAQSYRCVGDLDNAIKYYRRRVFEHTNYFPEETFHAAYQIGLLMKQQVLSQVTDDIQKVDIQLGEAIIWLLRSYHICQRVEPLVELTNLYLQNNNFDTAYIFCKQACQLDFPEDSVLFVNRQHYNYTRWHQMGHIAFYLKKYEEGLLACEKAIMACPDENINIDNKKFYIEKLKNKLTYK
eukprot:Pgem_evm3s6433